MYLGRRGRRRLLLREVNLEGLVGREAVERRVKRLRLVAGRIARRKRGLGPRRAGSLGGRTMPKEHRPATHSLPNSGSLKYVFSLLMRDSSGSYSGCSSSGLAAGSSYSSRMEGCASWSSRRSASGSSSSSSAAVESWQGETWRGAVEGTVRGGDAPAGASGAQLQRTVQRLGRVQLLLEHPVFVVRAEREPALAARAALGGRLVLGVPHGQAASGEGRAMVSMGREAKGFQAEPAPAPPLHRSQPPRRPQNVLLHLAVEALEHKGLVLGAGFLHGNRGGVGVRVLALDVAGPKGHLEAVVGLRAVVHERRLLALVDVAHAIQQVAGQTQRQLDLERRGGGRCEGGFKVRRDGARGCARGRASDCTTRGVCLPPEYKLWLAALPFSTSQGERRLPECTWGSRMERQ